MVDMSNCFSIQNPSEEITLANDDDPVDVITLPIVLDNSPRINFNFRFQFMYTNKTYYVTPNKDHAIFSDYTELKHLKRDLQSVEGADAYFSFYDQVSGFGDTIKCFARFVPGTSLLDDDGYAHIRLF